MTPKLDYRWNLRRVMASRDMYATTDLIGPLAERGIRLSTSQIYRLAVVGAAPGRCGWRVGAGLRRVRRAAGQPAAPRPGLVLRRVRSRPGGLRGLRQHPGGVLPRPGRPTPLWLPTRDRT